MCSPARAPLAAGDRASLPRVIRMGIPNHHTPCIMSAGQGARMPPGRDHSASAGALQRGARSSGASTEDSQPSPVVPEKRGNNAEAAVDGVVAENEKEKEDTVSTLVERLKALAEVWEVRVRVRLLHVRVNVRYQVGEHLQQFDCTLQFHKKGTKKKKGPHLLIRRSR